VIAEFGQQLSAPQGPAIEEDIVLVGLAARTEVDQLLLDLFATAVRANGGSIEIIDPKLNAEDAIASATRARPMVLCVAAISPTRGAELRNYCRRVRAALGDDMRIVALRPHLADSDVTRSAVRMRDAGADYVARNVREALEAVNLDLQVTSVDKSRAVASQPQRAPSSVESLSGATRAIHDSVC
jgi:hypothetical protein